MRYSRKYWALTERVTDELSTDYFEERDEELPEPRKGEIIVRALFISVDPITRLHIAYSEADQPILGRQVARVVESRNTEYPKGKLLIGSMGWSTYSVVDPTLTQVLGGIELPLIEKLPKQMENCSLPKSSALGLLGIPGLSAYIGLTELAKAQEGETIVISSAAGQMGHLVGQLAKEFGLKVIGFTGCSDKASWIKTELGYDWAFNYKTLDINQALNMAAPNGVDIFWDGVGGSFASKVLPYMTNFGRVIMVGNLANYSNLRDPENISMLDLAITLKELTIHGFNVYRYHHLWEEAREALAKLTKEGKITPYEHTVEGFEFLPQVFVDQMEGKTQGKSIVRI